jgi:hypothetical protein
MPSINADHQFYVIQTEFMSPEKAEFQLVEKKPYFPAPITIVCFIIGRTDATGHIPYAISLVIQELVSVE